MKQQRMVGKEIKKLANIIRILIFISYIIIGIGVYYFGVEADETGVFAIISVIIIVVGYIIAWLVTLILYGYGELIDQTMQTHYAVRDLQNMMYKELEKSNRLSEAEVALLTDIQKHMSRGE